MTSRFEFGQLDIAMGDELYDDLDRVPRDLARVVQLAAALYETNDGCDPGSLEAINEFICDGFTGEPYVIRDSHNNGKIAALADYESLNQGRHVPPNTAWLSLLVVDRYSRGMGMGRLMLGQLAGIAANDGVTAIRLRSVTDPRAINFYTQNGFHVEQHNPDGPIMNLPIRQNH